MKIADAALEETQNAELLACFEVKDNPYVTITSFDLKKIEKLLQAGADANVYTHNELPLTSQVARNAHIDISVLKLLMTYGGNPRLPSKRSVSMRARHQNLSDEAFYEHLYESGSTTFTDLIHSFNQNDGVAAIEERLAYCFPDHEANIPHKYRIDISYLEDIYLKLATKILRFFEANKDSNTKLVFILGESHNSYFSFVIEAMVLYILKEIGVSKLLLESDTEDLKRRLSNGSLSVNPVFGAVPGSSTLKIAQKLMWDTIPIDTWLNYQEAIRKSISLSSESSMKSRDIHMATEINSIDEDALVIVGSNHLYGLNVLNVIDKSIFNIGTAQADYPGGETSYDKICAIYAKTHDRVLRILSPFDVNEKTLKTGYTWTMLDKMIHNIHLIKFQEALSEAKQPNSTWDFSFTFWNENTISVKSSKSDADEDSFLSKCQIL